MAFTRMNFSVPEELASYIRGLNINLSAVVAQAFRDLLKDGETILRIEALEKENQLLRRKLDRIRGQLNTEE